jgi:hypothetical protein
LELTFTVEELDEVLLSMKPDSAPSPDGLSVLFFKRFSGILRGPILQILNDFALGRVDIARLNYGIITLIPKVKGNIGACMSDGEHPRARQTTDMSFPPVEVGGGG